MQGERTKEKEWGKSRGKGEKERGAPGGILVGISTTASRDHAEDGGVSPKGRRRIEMKGEATNTPEKLKTGPSMKRKGLSWGGEKIGRVKTEAVL